MVPDTGVVEALALVLPDAVDVVLRELAVLATDGIGFGSLVTNELTDKPVLWSSIFCGVLLEYFGTAEARCEVEWNVAVVGLYAWLAEANEGGGGGG